VPSHAPMSVHTLYFGPFRLDSELDIPELRSLTGPDDIAVTLRLGDLPAALDNPQHYGTHCQFTAAEYLLDIPGTARYYAAHGREVRVEIAPGAPIENVTTYLLGSVFGALCHQNGLLPLHASAVRHQGGVIAFLGDSGAGKSTLAACLQRHGHPLVSDDICLLQPHAGTLRVVPVAGWLKLWNQSLQHLGETPDPQHRVFSTDDKFRLYLNDPAPSPAAAESAARRLAKSGPEPSPLTLTHVLFLNKSTGEAIQPTLHPLSAPEAIAALMDFTYAAYLPLLTGQQSRIFRQAGQTFTHAQAYRLTLPWGLAHLDATLNLLDREIFKP
jgi:hypothetical protein